MIPFNFEYYRPDSVQEALSVYARLDGEGKRPYYHGGCTEIITMARMNNMRPGAVIDLKHVPDCQRLDWEGDTLIIGGAVSLTRIFDSGYFPLLGHTGARVADHTVQGKITLGGNLGSTIIYRETALPLLLAEAEADLEGPGGPRRVRLGQVFQRRLQLNRGEFIKQLRVGREYTVCPHYHAKKTRIGKIDYPLLTIAAMRTGGRIRAALSGVCPYPFRSPAMEEELNRAGIDLETRAANAAAVTPEPVMADLHASAPYRTFVLRNTLAEALRHLEEVN